MNLDRTVIERDTLSLLDAVAIIGGFSSLVSSVFAGLIRWLSTSDIKSDLGSRLF